MQRAYFQASFATFQETTVEQLLGVLVATHGLEVDVLQRNAWIGEIRSLQRVLPTLGEGHVLLEVAIPRMGKRADVVLLWSGIIFVVEYKVGAREFESTALDQVLDYALDLKNFHAGSHHVPIVPILIATEAQDSNACLWWGEDQVALPLSTGDESFRTLLMQVSGAHASPGLNVREW